MTARQSYRERAPVAALAPYATCVWIQQVACGSAPYTHRTVPNGSAELVCEPGGMPRLAGPRTGPEEATLAAGSMVVGVRLRPGAAAALLGVPASELVDVSIAAEELWGDGALALGEVVGAAATPQIAVAALEHALLARVAAAGRRPDALAIEAARRLQPWAGDGDVRSLTRTLHISERQLRRRFDAAVGLAPKVLQRMLRFQGFLALAQAPAARAAGLARLAADAGYADQAHLTREARRLAGRSPQVLLRDADRDCRHTHDHAASYAPLLRERSRR